MECTNCTQPNFPQTQKQFSLTNYVEIIIIESICGKNRNQYHLIPYNKITLRKATAQYATPDTHKAYKTTEIKNDQIKTQETSYNEIITKKATYFIINKQITCRINQLESILYQLWTSIDQPKITKNRYNAYRRPMILPSRTLFTSEQHSTGTGTGSGSGSGSRS